MTLAEFLKIANCTDADKAALLVYWKKPGNAKVPTDKFWKRTEKLQREIAKCKDTPFFKSYLNETVTVTVEKRKDDGSFRAFLSFGQLRLWNSITRADFILETLDGHELARGKVADCVKAVAGGKSVPAPIKKGRKGKKAAVNAKETRTPKEIQESIPLELRTGWINYDLLDKVNAEVCEESVKYWNAHDGKFPKRKKRN